MSSARSQRSTSSSKNKLRKPPPPRVKIPEPVHWLFRTNIPRRRQSYIPASPRRRNFFGLGEIVGVLTNPAGTVRSMTESKRLLDEARLEIQESRERAQIRPTHTFSRLPGFFPRRVEMQAIQRALEGEPSFTVLFGAPSVGKTAILRELLCHPRYHVLHFDLRIAGFADLESLYMSLNVQMEGFFDEIARNGGWYEEGSPERVEMSDAEIKFEGWDVFEREAWAFKHDRINIQRRLGGGGPDAEGAKGEVRPSDIARLMELFQSSLLRYREFQPRVTKGKGRMSEDTMVVGTTQGGPNTKNRWFSRRKDPRYAAQESEREKPSRQSSADKEDKLRSRVKRVPVIFFDEAHKLPQLIPSASTMQTILDSTLVLTKQDRLCHVVHATSDPFYQGWLSRVGVLWYCKLFSIGDLTKSEMRAYFRERVQPRFAELPHNIRCLDFETLYDAFGGKVAHWSDFVTDYLNSGGTLGIKQSSHFLQAHALLNLHIIHSSQAPGGGFDNNSARANTTAGSIHAAAQVNTSADANRSNPETLLHPNIGAAGFKMYQAGVNGTQPSLSFMPTTNPLIASFTPYEGVGAQPEFSPMQLLKVMSRFTTGGVTYLPYFHLCRELGARAVDGMIRGKVVDVKWTDGIPGAVDAGRRPMSTVRPNYVPVAQPSMPVPQHGLGGSMAQEASGSTAVDFGTPPPPIFSEEDEADVMVPVSEDELSRGHQQPQQQQQQQQQQQHEPPPAVAFSMPMHYGPPTDEGFQEEYLEEEEEEVIGPKLVPVSPIMRYAMREVVKEYEDDRSISEYASLSDVDEY